VRREDSISSQEEDSPSMNVRAQKK